MTITADKIREAIKSDPSLQNLAMVGDDTTLASQIVIREVKEYRLTSGGVLDILGAIRGQEVMTKLRSSPDFAEIVRLMDRDGVNLAHKDSVVVSGAMLAAGIITEDEVKTIRRLPIAKVNPTAAEVSKALRPWRPGGTVNQLVMENV